MQQPTTLLDQLGYEVVADERQFLQQIKKQIKKTQATSADGSCQKINAIKSGAACAYIY
jgi:hypothetical protein